MANVRERREISRQPRWGPFIGLQGRLIPGPPPCVLAAVGPSGHQGELGSRSKWSERKREGGGREVERKRGGNGEGREGERE